MSDAPSRIATYWRRWTRLVGLGVLFAGAWAGPAAAQTPVALELVLAVDASGSVDFSEFDLQKHGLAGAFRDPEVIAALEAFAPAGAGDRVDVDAVRAEDFLCH